MGWLRRCAIYALGVCWLVGTAGVCSAAERSFEQWLMGLREEARQRGISEETLATALRDVQPIERVITLDRRQAEFTQTFWTYLDRHVDAERIARGRRLLNEHRGLLNDVERRFGVQPRFLVAFWGMETDYGRHLGGFPVLEALATLAYDDRRSAFFRSELLDALWIVDQGHVAARRMEGSWAGAMGQLQFLPSTFRRYAVDANGDGQKDIWRTLPDVFASGGHYLEELGWRGDERWGREVRLPSGFDWASARLGVRKPLSEWAALGVRRANGSPLPKADMEASILLPQGHEGPAFLVYHNFRMIMRWNRSMHYALSVGHLADRIVGLPRVATGRGVDNEPLSRQQVRELQRQLNTLGFQAGPVDGLLGSQTRAALRAYQQANDLPADGYPDLTVLRRIRSALSPMADRRADPS